MVQIDLATLQNFYMTILHTSQKYVLYPGSQDKNFSLNKFVIVFDFNDGIDRNPHVFELIDFKCVISSSFHVSN